MSTVFTFPDSETNIWKYYETSKSNENEVTILNNEEPKNDLSENVIEKETEKVQNVWSKILKIKVIRRPRRDPNAFPLRQSQYLIEMEKRITTID